MAFLAFALVGCTSSSRDALEGQIVRVDEQAGVVVGFSLKTSDGSRQIRIDGQRDYGFPLTHLHEHQASGDPVRCTAEDRDGQLYAVLIEDAL